MAFYVSVTGPESRVLRTTDTTLTVLGLRNGVSYTFEVFAATADGRSTAAGPVSATPTTGVEGVVAGLIVQFAEGVELEPGSTEVPGQEQVSQVNLTAAEQITDDALLVELSEPVDLETAERIAADLTADELVEWAEPDQFLFTASEPATTAATATTDWNLAGAYGVDATSVANRDAAGDGVTVAIIDTGVTDHPSLRSRVVGGYDFVSSPEQLAASRQANAPPVDFDADYADTAAFGGIGRDANPADPGDWNAVRSSSWHGTQMAGVIADVAPGARILPVRALSWRGGLLSDIAASISWASGGTVDGVPANANPAKVINMSFSVEATCPVALQDAIEGARARGATLVAAAGNANDDASRYAPGNCNGVITVGATTSAGVRADYSNYGPVVDLSAPGGDNATPVMAASNDGTTTLGQPSTATTSGTSVAAAHVSAAAAVLAARQSSLDPDEAYRTLTGRDHVKAFANRTCDANPDYGCGTGILTLRLAQIAAAGDTDYHMNFSGSAQRAMGPTGFYPVKAASGESFTVSAWVFDNRDSQTGFKYVAAQQQALSSSFFLGLQDRNITLTDWDSEAVLPAKQWVHVAATRSGTTAILYVNGSEVDRITNYNPDRWYASGQQFRIGSFVDNRANEDWTGYIDQVKVYDTSLSAPQVLGDMQSWGVASGVSSGSLVAAYDFNEGSGSTVVNQGSVGSSGNLTTVNSPTWRSLVTPSTSGTTTTVLFPRSYLTSTGGWTAPVGVGSGTALVVGGGGAGGFDGGGGGGGGGTWTGTATLNAGGVNAVTVGQGGAPRVGYNPANNCWDGNSTGAIGCSGNSGTTSSFASVGATGGGGGGGKNAGGSSAASSTTDGSGGGGGGNDFTAQQAGGTGRYNGGSGGATTDPARTMGGGGGGVNGAGAVGNGNNNTAAGRGGSGFTSSLSGSALVYGTGGSGGAWVNCSFCIVNMTGTGAGTGGWDATAATSGTPNQGGGGGGAGGRGILGGYGGSGVVILQYSTVPGAPGSATATAGQQQVTLSWTAPTHTGGSAITGYRPQIWGGSSWSNPSAGTCATATTSTATSCTITGLTAGTTYSFQVQAINANGGGDWAGTNTAVPFGPLNRFAVTTTAGGSLGTQTVGTAFAIRVTAQDSGGRTVANFTGTVDLTSTSLFGAGGGTTAAFASGVLASHSVTLLRSGASQTITATKTASTEAGTSSAFTVSAGAATQLQTLLPGETAAPGTGSGKTGTPTAQPSGGSFITTVNAVDANWNVVSSTPTVRITSSDGAATLPSAAALVAGTKGFAVTLNTMGSQTVTATDASGSLTSSTSDPVSVGKSAQATLIVTSTTGTYGSALTLTTSGGSGTGAVSYAAVGGTALGCTVSGSTLTVTQAGTCLVTATKAEDANYAQAVSAQTTVTFDKAQQAPLTITSPSTVTYGDAVTLTTTGGSGTGAISFTPGGSTGTASCLVASGSTNSVTGTNAGGTCEVIGEKADDVNYQQVLTAQWVTVTTRPITVTASSPSIDYGQSLGQSFSVTSGSLAFSNAISAMTYTYTGTGGTTYGPSTTAPTAVGTYSVMPSAAVFSNGSGANYDIGYSAGTVTISQASQTISFAQPSGQTYGAAPYLLSPTASSGLAVSLASSTPTVCTVTLNVVSITGVGTCTLTASQAGNANYSAAPDVSRSFVVAQASQAALSISSPTTAIFGQTMSLVTSGGSGAGAVTYAVSGGSTCSVVGSTLTLGDAGSTCVVTATKQGDTNYLPVSSTAHTVVITQAGQTIAFTSSVPTNPERFDTYTPTATSVSDVTGASSGVSPTFAASGNCTMFGGVVTFGLPGTCTVTASAVSNTNFAAASNVTQVIVIGSTNQTITFTQPSNVSFGGSSVAMGATTSSNGDVTYARGSGTTNTACAVSTLGVVTILAVGTCEVVASAAAFDQYAAASSVTRAFQVLPALATAPTITSASAANQSMTVGLSAPGFTGGVSITAYQLVATPTGGGATVTSNACAYVNTNQLCTITGLSNGTAYTVTAAAINSAGVGPASAASTSLTAATSANSVGGLYATPGNNQVTLNWTALTAGQAGGGVFVRYDIYIRTAGGSSWTLVPLSLTSQSDNTATITGLSNGTSYDFRVVAITDINGTQTAGNTTEVSEYAAIAPSAPGSLAVLAYTATDVQVSWQAPLADGGAPLIAPYYSVTITSTTPGATTPITCTFASATDQYCTSASQLTNDALYTVTVTAINRIGSSTPVTTTYAVPSSVDTLSRLTVNGGTVTLTPVFASATASYTADVPFTTSSVTVTPTATSAGATITVNGAPVISGAASSALPLTVGTTTITVVVTASDPRYSETYTVIVTRQAAPSSGGGSASPQEQARVPVTPPSPVMGGLMPGAVLVDGELDTSVTTSRTADGAGWLMTGSGFWLAIETTTASGSPVPLSPSGAMQVPQGGFVDIQGSDYLPGSDVFVFAIPRRDAAVRSAGTRAGHLMAMRSVTGAIFLGSASVSGAGQVSSSLLVPTTVDLGSYVLQANGVSTQNQTLSVNMLLDVVAGTAPMSTETIRQAAFFKGGSTSFSKAGLGRLRALASAVPSQAEQVQVTVVGVATSASTFKENVNLARDRAERVAEYLERQGIEGDYTVTVTVTYTVGGKDRSVRVDTSGTVLPRAEGAVSGLDQPLTSAKGKPLTTASVSFTAPLQ